MFGPGTRLTLSPRIPPRGSWTCAFEKGPPRRPTLQMTHMETSRDQEECGGRFSVYMVVVHTSFGEKCCHTLRFVGVMFFLLDDDDPAVPRNDGYTSFVDFCPFSLRPKNRFRNRNLLHFFS